MSATAADVAKYTNDGVVITTNAAAGLAIQAAYADAQTNTTEIPMFFDSATVGQVFLDERFSYVSKINPPHVGVEVEDANGLGLGTSTPVVPKVPCFTAVDASMVLNKTLRTRAYTYDSDTDRYAVELID